MKFNDQRADDFCAVYVFKQGAVAGLHIFAGQGVKRVFHILSLHRFAIVKTCIWAQFKRRTQTIRRYINILCEQSVSRAQLVHRTRQQAFKHQIAQIRWRCAFDVEGVVFVKGGNTQIAHRHQLATFGRFGVHVIEMRKTSGIFDIAPQ